MQGYGQRSHGIGGWFYPGSGDTTDTRPIPPPPGVGEAIVTEPPSPIASSVAAPALPVSVRECGEVWESVELHVFVSLEQFMPQGVFAICLCFQPS